MWTQRSDLRARGSWVFEWRRPRPEFSDDLLILHAPTAAGANSIRAACPGRKFLHLELSPSYDHFVIVPD